VNMRRISLAVARRWGLLNSRLVSWIWARGGRTQPLRLGTAYGGWHCYTDLLHPGDVAFCIGAGEDVSFDVLLNARYGQHVVCVDPTPRAITHVHELLHAHADGRTIPIGGVGSTSYALEWFDADRFQLVPCAVWSSDTELPLYLPRDPRHVSLSAVNLQNTDRTITVPARRLETLLFDLRVTDISLLKMDIEGAEYEVLEDMLRSHVCPRQLLVEFEDFNRPRNMFFLPRVLKMLRRLRLAHYQLRHVEGANLLFSLQDAHISLSKGAQAACGSTTFGAVRS
jgi:FkbM family methyltransferase